MPRYRKLVITLNDAPAHEKENPAPAISDVVIVTKRKEIESVAVPIKTDPTLDDILKDLYDRLAAVKRERNKLSSLNATMIATTHARLSLESSDKGQLFMDGELPDRELALHYKKTEALTGEAISLWRRIKQIESTGTLPEDLSKPSTAKSDEALKYELIRLKDLISKTKTKIGKGHSNTDRMAKWEQAVAVAEARRSEINKILKGK
ncbi:MAG: hypothetical protein WDO15_09960 [Bacteroidota bacterium]